MSSSNIGSSVDSSEGVQQLTSSNEEKRGAWIGTLGKGRQANWDTCLDFELWGTGSNSGQLVEVGDDLFVWLAPEGWIAHCQVISSPRQPSESDPAPWTDGQTYKWMFGIAVVSQLVKPFNPGSTENQQNGTGLWNVQLKQFPKVNPEQSLAIQAIFKQKDLIRGTPGSIGVKWPVEPGVTMARSKIHDLVGGNRRSGITKPASSRDILVFSDVKKGRKFGYHLHEGFLTDGSFSYTGEGQEGDQTFDAPGNKYLRDADIRGDFIRLFQTDGSQATYLGVFTLGDPAFNMQRAPDKNGDERDVIVFNLVPVSSLPILEQAQIQTLGFIDWKPPSDSGYQIGPRSHDGGIASRAEFTLERRYGLWLEKSGRNVKSVTIPIPGTSLSVYPDLFNATDNVVIEAKKSSARKYVREALGQVLDYQNLLAIQGHGDVKAAILLPSRPDSDLVQLCQRLGIEVVIPVGEDFAAL